MSTAMCCETCGGDCRLPGDGDAKRGRDLRLLAGQPYARECGRIAANGGPNIPENVGRTLHDSLSPLQFEHDLSGKPLRTFPDHALVFATMS
jgi:hypothetical protein